MTYNMTVADVAKQLAKITDLSETYHARQLRAQIREGALVSPVRGGSGPTAPALFDNAGVARAMILHTLAMMGLEMPLLRQAARAGEVVDPTDRKRDTVEPSDGIALAIARMKADPETKMYLHLSLSEWPGEDGKLDLGGYVASTSTPSESPIVPPLAMIVLPLHSILKPVLGIA